MPIQFRCQKCSQWLEVDEPHAGGKAICPYCQAINDVPKQPAENNQARAPANPDEPAQEGEKSPYTGVSAEHTRPTAPDVPASKPLEEEERSSRAPAPGEYDEGWFDAGRSGLPTPPGTDLMGRLGVIGLLLSIISIAACFATVLAMVSFLPAEFRDRLSQGPTSQETVKQTQEQIMKIVQEHPWIAPAMLASLLLNIVGFGMSLVAALTPGTHRRRAAWAGVVIGGLLFLCICTGIMQQTGGVLTK